MSSPIAKDVNPQLSIQPTHGQSHSASSSSNLSALSTLPQPSSASNGGTSANQSAAHIMASSYIPLNSTNAAPVNHETQSNIVDSYGYIVTVSPNLSREGASVTNACVDEFYNQVLSYGKHWHTALTGLYYDHNNPFLNMLAFEYYVAAENFESAFVCLNRGVEGSKHYEPHVMPFFSTSRSALTAREKLFIQSYEAWARLDFATAAKGFSLIAKNHPQDQFAMKRAQLMYFLVGDHKGMLECLKYVQYPQPPFYHGMLSFALEQTSMLYGSLIAALHGQRIAQETKVRDPWVVHSAAHSLFFKQLHPEGAAMLVRHCKEWEQCMGFMFGHNWFHIALTALDFGDLKSFQIIYDTAIWTQEGEPQELTPTSVEEVLGGMYYTKEWDLTHTLRLLDVDPGIQVEPRQECTKDSCTYCAFHTNPENSAVFQQNLSVAGLEQYEAPFIKQRKSYSQDIAGAIGLLLKVETRLCILQDRVSAVIPSQDARWDTVLPYACKLSTDPFLVVLQLLALSRRKHERTLSMCNEFEQTVEDMQRGDSSVRGLELQKSALLVCRAARHIFHDEYTAAAVLLEQIIYGNAVVVSKKHDTTSQKPTNAAIHLQNIFHVYKHDTLPEIMEVQYCILDKEGSTSSNSENYKNRDVKTYEEYRQHPLDKGSADISSAQSTLAYVGGSNEQRVVFEDIMIHCHLLAGNLHHTVTLLQNMPSPLPLHYQHLSYTQYKQDSPKL